MPSIPSLKRVLAATRRRTSFLIPKSHKSKAAPKKANGSCTPRYTSAVARAASVESDSDVSSAEGRDFTTPSPSPSPVASPVELPISAEDSYNSSGDDTDDEDDVSPPIEKNDEPHYAQPVPFEWYFTQPELYEDVDGLLNVLIAEENNTGKGYVESVGKLTRTSVPAETSIATAPAPALAVVSAVPVVADTTATIPVHVNTSANAACVAAEVHAHAAMTPMGQAVARVAERIVKPLPVKQGRALTARAVARMTEGVKQMTVDPAKTASVDDIARLLAVTDVDMILDGPLSWGIEYQNHDWGHYCLGKRTRDDDESSDDDTRYSSDDNSSDDEYHGPALKRAKKNNWF